MVKLKLKPFKEKLISTNQKYIQANRNPKHKTIFALAYLDSTPLLHFLKSDFTVIE